MIDKPLKFFMAGLALVGLYLLLTNSEGFAKVVGAVFRGVNQTYGVLQGRQTVA